MCDFSLMKYDWNMYQNLNTCVVDESSTDDAEGHRKVANGRKVAGASRSLVNDMGLQLLYARVLHSLSMPVLIYGTETVIQKEKERTRIRAVQMDNLKGLSGIRRMDEVLIESVNIICVVCE